MPFTNAWDETTPTGSDNASTADDFFRKHRLDLGERLEAMFMGFNASSNASPENNIGVKFLKCYKQDSDPSSATDFGHLYVKLVSGVPELFYQDDTNTAVQLTSGGNLKSTAGLIVDGASTLTGDVTASGKLDVVGNLDPTTYETTNGGFLDEDDLSSDADDKVASQQSIKAYVDRGLAKAWVQFASNGTIQGTGLNITSVTRDGTGIYTIVWDTDFADNDYAVTATCQGEARTLNIDAISTSQITIRVFTVGSTPALVDAAVMVIAMGDQ